MLINKKLIIDSKGENWLLILKNIYWKMSQWAIDTTFIIFSFRWYNYFQHVMLEVAVIEWLENKQHYFLRCTDWIEILAIHFHITESS